jgi:hypothetical protein
MHCHYHSKSCCNAKSNLRRRRSAWGAIAVSLSSLGVFTASTVPVAAQPEFYANAIVGVSDGVGPAYLVEAIDSSSAYDNVAVLGFNKVYSNGTLSATAAANYRGFFSAGTYASGQVLNASYPTAAPVLGEFDTPFGYYVSGALGTFTQHRFISPETLTGPYGKFNWHVTGDISSNLGRADSRLDFAVTQGATSLFDIYNPAITPNLMTEFGAGNYSYTTGVALNTTLDFLFASSAFWQVTPADLATLGSGTKTIFGEASFMSTFTLDSIELFNGDGTRVNTWSLLDEATGQAIFNQNGRVVALDATSAPEPGSLALILPIVGMVGMVLRKHEQRRQRRRRK